MATYATYRHVELDNVGYGKKRVLKPPGGGSSDIFGAAPEETSPRRVKNHNQSQLGSALFGDTPNNSNSNETPRNKPDGNPVTGIGYGESQNNGPAVQNGTTSSNSSEKSNDTSPAAKVPARTRVPPGGYSSGLW
ncbi:microtubule-associated protein Jupiter [Apis florea]|uniref:microtubule-associated protein Jupiter n=1 Tax=Apis florea TaxID=7463 RepID=UPI0006292EDC|nr:microtubule-associated protein Jupiter [Apis florea]